MIVRRAEFLTSVMHLSQLPEDALPEIALAGRSNVGKSSLINRMLGRKSLAKTSSIPGKTQMLNYYKINDAFYFVDCPGYGYAKVPKSMKRHWGKLIETYLLGRKELRLILQLVDLRHPPTEDDVSMYRWLAHHGLPVYIVATKADKIPRSKWPQHRRIITDRLALAEGTPVILFSSVTGQGSAELWERIESKLPGM